MEQNKSRYHLHSLVALDECQTLLGIDGREDALLTFLLESTTFTIEEYCRRKLGFRRVAEVFSDTVDRCFTLREYPVRRVMDVHVVPCGNSGEAYELEKRDISVEPPTPENWAATVRLNLGRGVCHNTIRIIYFAGYKIGDVPPDLKSAVIEMAAWRYARHKAKKTGVVGGVKGGEQFENSVPVNVRLLLEPYRRVMI
jgi:uncharacterized phiE125 gp8 family phage protein